MLPSPRDLVGGKYRVIRLIGEGGMGVVYEAHHEHLGSEVALKFLHPDLAERPALVARFLQEARVSASIKSPHVTHVVDVDQTPEGAPYLVMELLEGESLETRLTRGTPLPTAEAVDIGIQILAALEAAHSRGVIHRDLKPDNVWLAPGVRMPHVKLLDFGIAKLKSSSEFQQINTRPGSMMGTPAYMAPEQAISADQVDLRADLYSFGVILYEMLSGKRPVDSDEPGVILEHLMRGEVTSLASRNRSLPPGLAAFVDRLVTPNPDGRPSSATDARSELARFARNSEHDVVRTVVPTTVPPDDQNAPPFVTTSQPALAVPTRTDAMPQMPDLAHAPTALPMIAPARAHKSRKGPWIIGAFVLAAVGGAGVWAYMNQSVFDDSALPPMPTAAAPTQTPQPTLIAPTETSIAAPAEPPRTFPTAERPPSSRETPEVPSPAPVPSAPAFSFPSLSQLPPFAIPSGFAIPSALPPFLRDLPGMAPAPAPSPTPTTPNVSAPSEPAPRQRHNRQRPAQQ